MLRTCSLALTASDTVGSRGTASGKIIFSFCHRELSVHFVCIHHSENIRNTDLHRTSRHAVPAGRTRYLVYGGKCNPCLFDRRILRLIERLEIPHEGQVVLHLLHARHARQDDHDIRQRGCKTDCPGRRRCAFVHFLENSPDIRGQTRQSTALDWLHDDDRFSVLYCNLVAGFRLDDFILPVRIVDLQLDKFRVRMLRQEFIEEVRRVVK